MTLKYKGKPILTTFEEQSELTEQLWRKFQTEDKHEFAQIANYYRVYLTEDIKKHLKKKYQKPKSENEIRNYNIEHLPDAIAYSMGKGHWQGIHWIADIKGTSFNVEDLAIPNYDRTLILSYQKSLPSRDVIEQNLSNDKNDRYIQYLDGLTENMYVPFMEVARVCFFKGFLKALQQLKELYKVEEPEDTYSPLTHLPVNKTVQITPAMEGNWIIGDENIEEWGIHWDIAYSEYDYKTGLSKVYTDNDVIVSVWKTTIKDIIINSQNNIGTFMILNQQLKRMKNIDFAANKDDTPILVLEYTFTNAITDKEKSPRILKESEQEALERAIIDRFCNKVRIPNTNTIVIYNEMSRKERKS